MFQYVLPFSVSFYSRDPQVQLQFCTSSDQLCPSRREFPRKIDPQSPKENSRRILLRSFLREYFPVHRYQIQWNHSVKSLDSVRPFWFRWWISSTETRLLVVLSFYKIYIYLNAAPLLELSFFRYSPTDVAAPFLCQCLQWTSDHINTSNKMLTILSIGWSRRWDEFIWTLERILTKIYIIDKLIVFDQVYHFSEVVG